MIEPCRQKPSRYFCCRLCLRWIFLKLLFILCWTRVVFKVVALGEPKKVVIVGCEPAMLLLWTGATKDASHSNSCHSSSLLLRLILTIHMQIAAARGLGTTLKKSQAFLASSFVRGVLRSTTDFFKLRFIALLPEITHCLLQYGWRGIGWSKFFLLGAGWLIVSSDSTGLFLEGFLRRN